MEFIRKMGTGLILVAVLITSGCGMSKTTDLKKKSNSISKLMIQAPSGLSISSPIYQVIEDNHLGETVEGIAFLTWDSPDELRARITSNQAQISALPTYVGANLYNKGADIQLINTLVWGVLYIVGADKSVQSLEDLKGKTVHVPFKGDMPDLVFRYLLDQKGMEIGQDIFIEYVSTPQETVQLVLAKKAEYAVLPEHTASMAVRRGNQEGLQLQKIISLQEEWGKITGKEARIPQAGIVVNRSLIQSNPEIVKILQEQLKDNIQKINDNPEKAAQTIVKYQDGLEEDFIVNLLPDLNLTFVDAQKAKEELEFFYTELAKLSPDIIGGKLPDEGFYYHE